MITSFTRTHLRWFVALLALAVFGSAVSFAQTSNGTIAGVVTDASGAVITNATVTAKASQTGDSRTVPTNSQGAYRIEAIIPGVYSITASAPTFANTNVNNINVDASRVTSVNVTLNPGASQVVNVEATAETLQTETGELSKTITTHDISSLPIGNLNAYALATTLPGVLGGVTSFSNGTGFSVNGARPRNNNFLIEGQDNNDSGIKGQGLQPSNLEAVKEVTILTNSYAAEFGNGGGSVNNIIFKSGTNQFHGSAWDLLSNSSLDANDHYNNHYGYEKSKYRENTFGFSIGGPVKRDKLFFFASYQWDKYRAGTSGGTLTIPTAAGFAVLQSLPTNPRIANLLAAYGSLRGVNNPQNITLGGGRPDVQVGSIQRQGLPDNSNSSDMTLKGDYLITSKDTLNLRWVRSPGTWPLDTLNYPSQLPGFDQMQYGVAHNAGLTYTRVFSPSIVNELRMSYGRIGFFFDMQPETYKNPLATGPSYSISGLTGFGAPGGNPQSRFHNTYQLQDALNWSKGNHSFKFGFDIADVRVRDAVPFNFYGAIGYAAVAGTPYSGLANYIDDFGGKSSTVTHTFGNPVIRPSLTSEAFYMQDTWKLRPNFTLSYGLRYDLPTAPGNSMPYPAMNIHDPFPAAYPEVIKEKRDTNNFGPRVSFAYTPRFWQGLFGDNKTVLRSGFGVFYDGIFTNILDNTAAASPNAVAASVTSAVSTANPRGTPNWSAQLGALSPKFSVLAQQTTMAHDIVSPKTLQWNLNVQRELPGGFTAEVGYVGTRGIKQYAQSYLNPFTPAGTRLNTTRGAILVRDNSGDMVYHGLAAQLNRRFKHGLMFRTAYTFSKNIDDVSEIFTTGNYSAYPSVQAPFEPNRGKVDRGSSALDRRQRLVFAYAYDIPHVKGGGILKPVGFITNGWTLSGTTTFQTGAPGNIQVGYDVNGDGITNDRPSLGNKNAPLATYGWDAGYWWDSSFAGKVCDGAVYWNKGTCTVVDPSSVHWIVPGGTNGNFGRNSVFVPGTQTWNLDIARSFKIHESHEFNVRAEMFNVFNHANTGVPNFSLVSGIPLPGQTTTFGQYNLGASGNRSIRIWVKYAF